MKVIIYGPNLADQSHGSFIVHADGCRDVAPRDLSGGYAPGWAIDVDTRAEAVVAVYADQMAEGSSYEECREDLHFMPCCNALPEGVYLPDDVEDEVKGRQDVEAWDRDAAQGHVLEAADVLGEFSALMATGMEATFNAYSESISKLIRAIGPAAMIVRQAAGADDGPSVGIHIGDMPPDLLLENADVQPYADAVQAAGEYTLYLHAHSTAKLFAGLLEAIGRDVGLEEGDVTRRFAAKHREMRGRLTDEGIAQKGGD